MLGFLNDVMTTRTPTLKRVKEGFRDLFSQTFVGENSNNFLFGPLIDKPKKLKETGETPYNLRPNRSNPRSIFSGKPKNKASLKPIFADGPQLDGTNISPIPLINPVDNPTPSSAPIKEIEKIQSLTQQLDLIRNADSCDESQQHITVTAEIHGTKTKNQLPTLPIVKSTFISISSSTISAPIQSTFVPTSCSGVQTLNTPSITTTISSASNNVNVSWSSVGSILDTPNFTNTTNVLVPRPYVPPLNQISRHSNQTNHRSSNAHEINQLFESSNHSVPGTDDSVVRPPNQVLNQASNKGSAQSTFLAAKEKIGNKLGLQKKVEKFEKIEKIETIPEQESEMSYSPVSSSDCREDAMDRIIDSLQAAGLDHRRARVKKLYEKQDGHFFRNPLSNRSYLSFQR